MFEQDYILRLIKEMVRALLKLLFHVDTESQIEELLEEKEQKQTLDSLLDMIDDGDINGAENRLYELLSHGKKEMLGAALLFYSYLNEKDDDFLAEQNYSREEIALGLKSIASNYNLNGIVEAFFIE